MTEIWSVDEDHSICTYGKVFIPSQEATAVRFKYSSYAVRTNLVPKYLPLAEPGPAAPSDSLPHVATLLPGKKKNPTLEERKGQKITTFHIVFRGYGFQQSLKCPTLVLQVYDKN